MNRVNEKKHRAASQRVAVAESFDDAPSPGQRHETAVQSRADNQAEGVLLTLAKVVEQRDRHTAGHCERLAFSSVALGVAMGLDSASLLTLYLGGYLHDVGKVG